MKTTHIRHSTSSEYLPQRDEELLKAYRRHIGSAAEVNRLAIASAVAKSPCSRFWVSEERAVETCRAIRRDGAAAALRGKHPSKQRMFIEIWKRVSPLLAVMPLADAVFEVVNSPAPEFYLSTLSAAVLVDNLKKRNKRNGRNFN